jgi:hypothetical protein
MFTMLSFQEQEAHVQARRAAAGGVFVGFVPWIVYWGLSGAGLGRAAVLAALATGIVLCARQAWLRSLRPVEATGTVFFAAHALVTLGLGSSFFERYGTTPSWRPLH